MTNAEIVEYYMNDDNGGNLIQKCVDYQFKKLAKVEPGKWQYKDDFYDDLVILLLEYNHDKLLNAHENGHMNALITRIIQNNIYSKSSKFYATYLKFNNITNDLDDLLDDDTDDDKE